MNKKVIAVVFGGTSVEHEISLISAKSVISNLDKSRFDVLPVFISKNGMWKKVNTAEYIENGNLEVYEDVFLAPLLSMEESGVFLEIAGSKVKQKIKTDVIFPVLHGTYGEDGTVQGLFELINVPYVGANVLGSSVGMDKIVMKDILSRHDLPVVEYTGFNKVEWENKSNYLREKINDKIGFPCFVKSADLGSSVGVKKIFSEKEIESSVEHSFAFSRRVIVEKSVENARELEVSVLGNENPIASLPGEIIPKNEFYDYRAKYHDEETELILPAELNKEITEILKELAVKTYSSLCCSGLGRIDFLMNSGTKEIFISEINTIPGFTSISMYPKLWEISGISYKDLLTRLIQLAIENYDSKKSLRTDFTEN